MSTTISWLYFTAFEPTHGLELWRANADGSVVLAADINPGANSSEPRWAFVPGGEPFTVFDNALYFLASEVTYGTELWKLNADGSVVLAADVNPGAASSNPQFFTVFNNALYFNATDATHGTELWKLNADGSLVLAADINAGAGSSSPQRFTAFNNALYFAATDPTRGFELWKVKADGSVVLAADINPGAASSIPGDFTVFNNEMYFQATTAAAGGELWKVKADGSLTQVMDINPGAGDSSPNGFTAFNNEMYFQAATAADGRELWKVKSDGSAVMVANINPGAADSVPTGFTVFNNELYFAANYFTSGIELWKVKADGSVVLAADIRLGTTGSSPQGFTVFNNALYFQANDGTHGNELWKVNADGSVVLAADINPFGSSNPQGFTVFNNALYFRASDALGIEPWRVNADGSVVLASDIYVGAESSNPRSFTVFTATTNDTVNETAPASVTATVGVSKPISGVQVIDDALIGETYTTVLSDTIGNLSATGPAVSGSGTHNLTITGQLSTVNAALGTLTYSGSVAGTDSISVKTTDSDGSTVTKSIAVTVAAVQIDNQTTHVQAFGGTPYSGPVAGLQYQYIDLNPNNLNVTALVPNGFIHTGNGFDAIDVSKVSGTNVLDGGTNSNFLVGGTAAGSFDTFFVDNRNPPGDIWSTVVNFHKGDDATVWGVTQAGFNLAFANGEGAAGFTGLTLHVTKAGVPTASLTLAGYSTADLTNGKLSTSFGSVGGSDYFFVHGNA